MEITKRSTPEKTKILLINEGSVYRFTADFVLIESFIFILGKWKSDLELIDHKKTLF